MEVVEIPRGFIPNFARGLDILLVDDDTAFLMYLASLLEQYTYKVFLLAALLWLHAPWREQDNPFSSVTTTRLATVALSMIREQNDKFKLVMANVNMADMDGHKFMRQLFKKKIPVIAISSERSVSAACRAMKAGASLCLDKPISLYDLKYLWQYVFEKTTICRVKVNTRKKSQGTVVRDEGRKTEAPNGIALHGVAGYQNATAPGSKGKGQVVGFKDLDASNRQQMMADLEVEVLEDGANHRQVKADPKGEGKQMEGEVLNGTANYQQMISPNADSGDKGKQVDAQVLHSINNFNQPTTQLKTQGRKIGVEQIAILKENFTKEAERIAVEISVLKEIQKQDASVIIKSQQQSTGSKRPTDGDEGRHSERISSSGTTINLEKQKEIECNKGEETERFKNNINTDSFTGKRPRIVWDHDLQTKFMFAISALGDQKVRPKKILEKMNVACLSQRQVSSHLQIFKAQIRHIYDHATTDSSVLNEPSPFNNETGVPLLGKTGSERGQVGNQGSDYGIEGDKSGILKAPTNGVNQDIFSSFLSGIKYKAPLMSGGTSQRQQGYGGGHFTIEKVANAIKLATTSTARNQKLDCIKPQNHISGRVPDTIKFPTNPTDKNRNMDPKVSSPNPCNVTNTDEFVMNEMIQELDTIEVSDPLSSSLNQNQSLSDFTYMLNLLEEEPLNSIGLTDEPNPDEVAGYLESLSQFLLGNDSPQP